jgi:sugar lactone lactonase YvrE
VPAGAAAAPARTIWTVAGTGAACATAPQCGDGGAASGATVGFPQAVAVGPGGVLYVADLADNEVRKVSPGGVISIVAGDGTPCQSAPSCGDGGPATGAQLNAPTGVAVDGHGDVFIADAGDDEVREVTPNGTITRIAGNGAECADPSSCGDRGRARSAALSSPDGVAVDGHGDVFIADSGDNEIRRVDAHATITTVAGDGSSCAAAPACGDGGSATGGQLSSPESVAVDSHGALFIADNGDNEIRRVSAGKIARVAGSGTACATPPGCGDGASALKADLNAPEGVAVDPSGDVVIADWGDNEVRIVSAQGAISRLAGTGTPCALPPACGDTGAAASARLNGPDGVAVTAGGDVFIGDTYDNEIRLVPGTRAAPARAPGAHGSSALLAFTATTTRAKVAVEAVLNARARVSLSVVAGKATPVLVMHSASAAGLTELDWNRRLHSKPAPHGRYTLIVSARFGRTLVSSRINVTL